MDRSDAPFRRCTRRSRRGATRGHAKERALSGAAGLAVLASVRSGFAQAPAENDLTDGKEWNNGYQTQRLTTFW